MTEPQTEAGRRFLASPDKAPLESWVLAIEREAVENHIRALNPPFKSTCDCSQETPHTDGMLRLGTHWNENDVAT